MKNAKIILLTLLTTAGIFGVAVFSACTKANCTGIVCQNGGACANGVCSCPTGFSGTFCQTAALTALVYQNNTFTPISITVNGASATIPVGGTYAFAGKFGTTATGTATTSGAASSLGISLAGGILGLTISWDINNSFPASDTQRIPLDVGATYFFLRAANSKSHNIIDYYVNIYSTYGQYYADATIPNNGQYYDLGYYLAYTSSNMYVKFADNTADSAMNLNLQFTNNQIVTLKL